MSGSRITLDMLGELMLNMQADLQVVSVTMLRLDRSIDRLRDEIQGVRDEMHEIRNELRAMHRQGQRTVARVRRLEEGAAQAREVP